MKKINLLSNICVYVAIFLIMALSVSATQQAVDLGSAGNYAILAESGISTTGTTAITGDLGVSPIDGTAITGFGLIMDSTNQFSTSALVTGKVYAADYAVPTPSILTTAISDMHIAYTDAAGRSLPDETELGAGDISGMTLSPGLYKWGTGLMINTGVTLDCPSSSNTIFIFQIAEDLIVGNGAIIALSGDCQANNIFWQVGGQTTLGTTSDFKGIILSKTLIEMNTGATLNGRALAQTAVTLDSNAVTTPKASVITTTPEVDNDDSSSSSCTPKWECIEWSSCDNNLKTRTCTDKWDCEKDSGKPTETQSCTSTLIPKYPIIDKDVDQEIISENAREQIRESNEEIRSGDYDNYFGQEIRVRNLEQNNVELKVNDVSAQTNLSINAETNSQGKTKLTTMLRSGQQKEIKIMPDTASEIALERLRLKVCSTYNNCTIQIKSVGTGDNELIQYEVQLDRHSRIIGIFQKKMHVTVDIDAETGEIMDVHKPWWAFIATEPEE